jgi:hypothetical protein
MMWNLITTFSIGETIMCCLVRWRAVLAAAFLALGLLGTSARADLIVTIAEDAGAPVTVVNVLGSPTSDLVGSADPASTTHYSVRVLGGEADQFVAGGVSMAQLFSSTVSITRLAGAGTHVLHIVVEGTGYTAPTAPPTISADSQIGGSVAHASPTNTLVFQSYANGVGFGAQHPGINTVSSYNDDKTGSIASLASGFSIKQTIDVELNGVGDKINYSSSTSLSQAVPEPSSLVLAGISALGMIGYGLRRRKALGA